MQLTRLCRGHVLLNELGQIFDTYDISIRYTLAQHFSRRACPWVHTPGEEWLAANPFRVLRLRRLLEEAMDVPQSFHSNNSPFQSRVIPAVSSDQFIRFPVELRHLVLQHLGARDIASLRLASRAFYHLPVLLWHRLLRDEMPWLWEIRSDEPPYFWATVTEQDLNRHEDFNAVVPDASEYARPLQSHGIDAQQHQATWVYPTPPLHRTNWFMLYCGIKRNWTDMKGLRNRKRIWQFQSRLLDLVSINSITSG